MMASSTVRFRQRELMGRATLTIVVTNPVRHRVLAWLGVRLVGIGASLLGVGRVEFAGEIGVDEGASDPSREAMAQ